jgi:hypothetical protein
MEEYFSVSLNEFCAFMIFSLWVLGLCPLSSFPNSMQYFRNWICFCPQVKIWEGTYSVESVRKRESRSLEKSIGQVQKPAKLYVIVYIKS